MRVLLTIAGCVGWLLIFAGALQFFAVLPELTKPAIVVVPQLILAAISGTGGWLIVAVTAAGLLISDKLDAIAARSEQIEKVIPRPRPSRMAPVVREPRRDWSDLPQLPVPNGNNGSGTPYIP